MYSRGMSPGQSVVQQGESAGQSVVRQPGALRVDVLPPACRVLVQQGGGSGLPGGLCLNGGGGGGRLRGRPGTCHGNTKIRRPIGSAWRRVFSKRLSKSWYLFGCSGYLVWGPGPPSPAPAPSPDPPPRPDSLIFQKSCYFLSHSFVFQLFPTLFFTP